MNGSIVRIPGVLIEARMKVPRPFIARIVAGVVVGVGIKCAATDGGPTIGSQNTRMKASPKAKVASLHA